MIELLRTMALVTGLNSAAPAIGTDVPIWSETPVSRVVAAPQMHANASTADEWLGSDKFRHVGVSYATVAFAFAAASAAGQDADEAITLAVPVAVAAGIGKELVDRRRGGAFSMRDLSANALGVAVAFLVLREVQ